MRRYLVLILAGILVLAACAPAPTLTPTRTPVPSSTIAPTAAPDPTPTPDPEVRPLNLLVSARGSVHLKREGWPDYQATAFGALLNERDLLQLEGEAQATVLCADLSTWPVPGGGPSGALNLCAPTYEPPLMHPKGKLGPTKARIDPLIPFVIRPRATDLLSDRPVFRWNPVPGVVSYTVRLHPNDWQTVTTATEVVYPPDAPDLEPQVGYLLLISTDTERTSEEEGVKGRGFKLLSAEEQAPILAHVEQLRSQGLPPEAEAYAVAQLYAGQGLFAEAIDQLEALAGEGSEQGAVYRSLGELYFTVGLDRLAEGHYVRAAELAEEAGDKEGTALAQIGLGQIYAGWGNADLAADHLEQAQRLCEEIGDQACVERVKERLGSLY